MTDGMLDGQVDVTVITAAFYMFITDCNIRFFHLFGISDFLFRCCFVTFPNGIYQCKHADVQI